MRCRVEQVFDATIRVTDEEGKTLSVQLAHTPFSNLLHTAHEGDTLNIIGGDMHRGVLTPVIAVLEPDMLVDVTTLCGCLKPYGFNALNALLGQYESRETTWQIQLGNMANDFFDACVNEAAPTFRSSVARSFRTNALVYSSIDGIDAGFFYDAEQQFNNIYRTIRETLPSLGVTPEDIILEPQFLSPELGLQGRMDALAPNAIIELKSGKADEFHGGRPKEEHELQMILYKEILTRMDARRGNVRNMLFYSRYPKLLPVNHTQLQLQQAIAVRNDIVALERDTREGRLPEVLNSLTETDFHAVPGDKHPAVAPSGRLYENYLRPIITRLIQRMQSLPPLERAYFHAFARFIAREQHASKQQFAQVWRTPIAAQEAEGMAVTGLRLHPIKDMEGSIIELRADTDRDLSSLNFRVGDSLMLFEQIPDAADFKPDENNLIGHENKHTWHEIDFIGHEMKHDCTSTSVIRSQVFRCQVVCIGQHSIHLALAYKQRSERVFHLDSTYAVAPSYMESTFMHAYRGLTAIVTAPAERRALLLGAIPPIPLPSRAGENQSALPPGPLPHRAGEQQSAGSPSLWGRGAGGGAYFLLVGPPGTGKTNVHLRGMVRQYLDKGQTLLVMAYTNQAVDEICGVLHEECPTLYARIGNENSCAAPYRPRMMQNIAAEARNRREMMAVIEPLRVICGTIASISGHDEIFRLKRFDTTIVDEASQVLEPQILPILCRVGRFILIGDHKQLPAVVVQDREGCAVNDPLLQEIGLTNCANSYFERLYALQHRWGIADRTTATLSRQGRMHRDLMSFVNQHFYGGQLDIIPLPHQTAPLPYSAPRLQFIDSAERNCQLSTVNYQLKSNLPEAEIVAQTVADIQRTYAEHNIPFSPTKTIGIIVPFRAQITAIRSAIADRQLAETMTIDTVERYQGSQRDIIIFDTVVTRPDMLDMISTPVALDDGTEIDRKLNVALTRARERFILVGHRPTLVRSTLYAALIRHITDSANTQDTQ